MTDNKNAEGRAVGGGAAQPRALVKLGERMFHVIDFERRTVAQDLYLQRLIRATGLDRTLPAEDEPPAAYLVRLQAALADSGKAVQLIAGYLLPQGTSERDWTEALAAETARHILGCDTREDRDQVASLALDCVFGFFRQGLERLARSRASFAEAQAKMAPASPTPSTGPIGPTDFRAPSEPLH